MWLSSSARDLEPHRPSLARAGRASLSSIACRRLRPHGTSSSYSKDGWESTYYSRTRGSAASLCLVGDFAPAPCRRQADLQPATANRAAQAAAAVLDGEDGTPEEKACLGASGAQMAASLPFRNPWRCDREADVSLMRRSGKLVSRCNLVNHHKCL